MTEKWNLWLHSLRCLIALLLKWNLWLRSLRWFTSLLLKWNIWLRSLHCFTSKLWKWNLWLRSLHCFPFTTIKMKSLTTLITLFYFTTTNPGDRTTLTTLLLSLIQQIVVPQEFQCFYKISMCHSNFTVRKSSGTLHNLLPRKIDKSLKFRHLFILQIHFMPWVGGLGSSSIIWSWYQVLP